MTSFFFVSVVLLLIGSTIFFVRWGKKYGENAIMRKSLEEELDDVAKAKHTRDNLDDAKRKRLRKKYTRR